MTSHCDWYSWDNATVVKRLEDHELKNQAAKFKEDGSIKGKELPSLTKEKLSRLGVNNESEQLQVIQFIKDTCENRKLFGDPIHGHIDLHPLCVKIVDTPHFQRLREIKQLGTCYYVYPGASHNRFEHSLGVCHLAGQLLRAIQRRQPSLEITEKDILCVEIAGLCHDLGQGPFSRLFDKKFIPAIRQGSERLKHGDVSKKMFSDMLKQIYPNDYFSIFDLTDDDIKFIEDLISVPKEIIQRKEKPFLYEIVANTRNGIDVVKWDYIARDCHSLGIRNSFDHNRCIHLARVIQVDSQLQICFRDKEAGNLYEMFHTRWILQRKAYQHRVTNVIEDMIKDAMVKSNDILLFEAENGEEVEMSNAFKHMAAYIKLTDKVIDQIIDSPKSGLEEAKRILQNVKRRELYKFVGQTNLRNGQILDEALVRDIEKKLEKKIVEINADMQENKLDPEAQIRVVDSIVILPVNTDYGMNDKNPIDKVYFYRKSQPTKGFKISKDRVSWTLPDKFAEQIIRVHSKLSDQLSINMISIIKQAFIEVCKENNFPDPEESDDPDQ